ncbi:MULTISPECIES: hypothetical protein [Kamptonema]|nr:MULTISPECIES: hypothetical protein [Kamptonema]CBN55498.1 hypothetical protein OSCI_2020018 [Kamptonema sp. PCC 6506]
MSWDVKRSDRSIWRWLYKVKRYTQALVLAMTTQHNDNGDRHHSRN